MITFRSLARDIEIGANSYLLDFGGATVLLDAGMHPKRERAEALPHHGEIGHGELDAALLSHAHLDHSGTLPLLQRNQPGTPVYMTEATAALTEALLHNAVNVMGAKREELGIEEYPLFSHREVGHCGRGWQARRVGQPFDVAGAEVRCTLFDAGHIMGAAGAKFEHRGRSVFYAGDVHFEDQTIVRGADFPRRGVDVLIIESTRGDTDRDPEYTRWREGERIAALVEGCLEDGGSVLVPVFAMGKTQETVMLLYELQRARRLRPMPFHIGGLSIKMTKIYDRFTNRVRRNHRGLHMLREKGLLAVPRERGVTPQLVGGQVYAVSSGMMSEHTMSNRLARQFISDPKNLLLTVGYADPDSPMARVLASERGEGVVLDSRHEPVRRECELGHFDLSGHAPREQIVDYVAALAPEITLLVHGDKAAIARTRAEIEARVPSTRVIVPRPLETVEIG